MDIDLRDKRNRFQVNRVDSEASSPTTRNGGGGPTLVGYTHSDGNSKPTNNSACSYESDTNNEDKNATSYNHKRLLPLQNIIFPSKISGSSASESSSIKSHQDDDGVECSREWKEEDANLNFAFECDAESPKVEREGRRSPSEGGYTSPTMLISPSHRPSLVDPAHFTLSANYDTKHNAKSFRHFTREALPRLDNYRNMMSIQAACKLR